MMLHIIQISNGLAARCAHSKVNPTNIIERMRRTTLTHFFDIKLSEYEMFSTQPSICTYNSVKCTVLCQISTKVCPTLPLLFSLRSFCTTLLLIAFSRIVKVYRRLWDACMWCGDLSNALAAVWAKLMRILFLFFYCFWHAFSTRADFCIKVHLNFQHIVKCSLAFSPYPTALLFVFIWHT